MSAGQTTGQGKDFLALAHGEEWTSFYESFDKLVQDNLSRSSELLRKAMALPEVADREVAQVKSELETRLQVEQDRHKALLGQLGEEIGASHQQVSTLADVLGSVIGNLDKLSQRVGEALASFNVVEEIADSIVDDEPVEASVGSNGHGSNGNGRLPKPSKDGAAGKDAIEAVTFDDAPIPDVVADIQRELAQPSPSEESGDSTVAAGESAPTDATEPSIDLNALAEAEAEEQIGGEETAEPVSELAPSDRPRPHWLSVTRVNARGA